MSPRQPAADGAASHGAGHERRGLVRVGARALAGWIGTVITLRRRLLAVALGVGVAVASGLLLARLLTEGGPLLATAYGTVFGALSAGALTSSWLARAARRIAMTPRGPLTWRDQPLLDRSVDRLGRVTIAPGTAERVAIESRRALAAHALGLPAVALVLGALALAYPFLLASDPSVTLLLMLPLWAVTTGPTLWTAARAAGPLALLRDAADAELALPESEPAQASPVDPPLGNRLP
jgi:hypothetical protein